MDLSVVLHRNGKTQNCKENERNSRKKEPRSKESGPKRQKHAYGNWNGC